MGHPVSGFMNCGQSITCEWRTSIDLKILRHQLINDQKKYQSVPISNNRTNLVTVSVYNAHDWTKNKHFDGQKPALCFLPTNLTMGESEESLSNRPRDVESSFLNFDGFSTTANTSSLQRIYKEAVRFNESFLMPSPIYSGMIKGGSFVLSLYFLFFLIL